MMDVRDYVGLPYKRRGCWDLLRVIYRDKLHINLPEYAAAPYDNAVELAALIQREIVGWKKIPNGEELPGDGVLFNLFGKASHVGVVIGDGRFIHVLRPGHLSCVESYRSVKWNNRVEGFYRFVK